MMDSNRKGYWVYSIIAIIIGFSLFGFLGYLIYDLIIKLSAQDFSNNTVVQALITLIITVFIGGYYSKWLEQRNAKKIELYKIQSELAISIINLASAFIYEPDDKGIELALVRESSKVKLYFDNKTLHELNEFIKAQDKKQHYDPLIDCFKKQLK